MSQVKLERFEYHLREKLKNKEFRQLYAIERGRVVLAQKIAKIRQGTCLQ